MSPISTPYALGKSPKLPWLSEGSATLGNQAVHQVALLMLNHKNDFTKQQKNQGSMLRISTLIFSYVFMQFFYSFTTQASVYFKTVSSCFFTLKPSLCALLISSSLPSSAQMISVCTSLSLKLNLAMRSFTPP